MTRHETPRRPGRHAAHALAALLFGLMLGLAPSPSPALDQGDTQCFRDERLVTLDKEKVAGGEGTLFGRFSFTRDQAKPEHAIKEIGFMRLEPGSSIGPHKHALNEDAYIILKGAGTFSDGKTETAVGPGDITIARPARNTP